MIALILLYVTGFDGRLLSAILLVFLGWSLINTFRLHNWLNGGQEDPPESFGIWSDIFHKINLLQSKNRKQRDQKQVVIEEFRSMTNALPDATLVLDGQECLSWFNSAATRVLGLRNPDDLGQPVTNLLREPDFANWISVEDQIATSFQMTSPLDPTTILNISAIRYRNDQKLVILRDVTDVHNLEIIRRDFVANVSHELRTPLTVLVGYLEALDQDCPEEMVPAITIMQEQSKQMQALLEDLLELSRLQTTERNLKGDVVDVPAILKLLKKQAKELSQGKHEFVFKIEPGLKLIGSAIDLESVFRNLIINAIHYTPHGGKVKVVWGNKDQGPVFSVKDNGIGIPRRDIPRLTERFYRVGSDRSRHSGGTGLGLAIVKHVLNAHEATLDISSELGDGSTFRCLFPTGRDASTIQKTE